MKNRDDVIYTCAFIIWFGACLGLPALLGEVRDDECHSSQKTLVTVYWVGVLGARLVYLFGM